MFSCCGDYTQSDVHNQLFALCCVWSFGPSVQMVGVGLHGELKGSRLTSISFSEIYSVTTGTNCCQNPVAVAVHYTIEHLGFSLLHSCMRPGLFLPISDFEREFLSMRRVLAQWLHIGRFATNSA